MPFFSAVKPVISSPSPVAPCWTPRVKLVRALMALNMVDQINLVMYPIIFGQGQRLFPQERPDVALELLSWTSPSVLTMQSYRTKGRPDFQRATLSTDNMSRSPSQGVTAL